MLFCQYPSNLVKLTTCSFLFFPLITSTCNSPPPPPPLSPSSLPCAAMSFPSMSSNLKRHGSETEVNRAGTNELERHPLFHSQQRRSSPQRRFHVTTASTAATLPAASLSKSVTIASAPNHLQNHPTISSSAHRDPRGHGSLGRGRGAGGRAGGGARGGGGSGEEG